MYVRLGLGNAGYLPFLLCGILGLIGLRVIFINNNYVYYPVLINLMYF